MVMISILIPAYNYDIYPLVEILNQQIEALGNSGEIIVLDDGSSEFFIRRNNQIAQLKNVTYEVLSKNVGRAKIRNLLAQMANQPYLLFIDCDSAIPDDNYLTNYLDLATDYDVICGGTLYNDLPPADDYLLHWIFGKAREEKDEKTRNQFPNNSFTTNNFLIKKELFESIRFNEQLAKYGHEDTLFGFDLLNNKINIHHINNPVVHMGLSSNMDFINKTKQSIENLIYIINHITSEPDFFAGIRLLKWYNRLTRLHLTKKMARYFIKNESAMIRNLTGPKPSLRKLDLLKIGYLCLIADEYA